MRSLTLVLALAVVCAALPAWAQARILTAHDQARAQTLPAPALEAAAPQAPQPLAPADQQPSPSPAQQPAPPPAKTEARMHMTPPPPPPSTPGRFSFARVDEGILRLDHATGKLAYCRAHPAGWSCQAVPEHRDALEQEITRLQAEVAALKKEIAGLRALPPRPPEPVPPPAAAPGKSGHPNESGPLKLPSKQDVARARAYIAQTWHRLVDMINDIQKGMFGRHDHDSGLSRT